MVEDDGPEAHRSYEDMAVSHVLGGLDSDQGRVFRSHLLECSDCRARVGELRAIASDLAGVERDERRDRSAKAVEVKRRAEAAAEADSMGLERPGVSRWVVLGLVVVIVCLAAYSVVLRGHTARLEQAMANRLEASAVMEFGEELAVDFRAPDVDATAKVRGDRIVVLLEGARQDTTYGVYLVDDDGGRSQTVYRDTLVVRDGRGQAFLPLDGTEDRLIVTVPEQGVGAEPDGRRLLEAVVPPPQERPASVGSA
jgi:hypothetical protein